MPGKPPNIVKIYRIVHIDNIEYLLTHGLFNREHEKADPNYINIGDSDLIRNRHDYPVGINPPGGSLGEFIPFYFGRLSPMLLKIKTGGSGVNRLPQEKIVYIVCKVDDIVNQCEEWCFTDGHAKKKISAFYNKLDDLDEVYWDKVDLRYWNNTEEDFDKMRHKQAEFLVRFHVPVNCILGLVTHNKSVALQIEQIVESLGLEIPVRVNPSGNYYY
ncbi:DUF4433 domain-containing protein [Pedobacter sp. MC2016-24]|uniref:type II toxin-antitoxin system toxin DNA ADP-ribosyl transferase DarT n=1 Tax=Pedobacter sp. MC2016-24 TaxID=2780090 RepID=UPI0018813035|nr:DUF4433 domain-containing protein [Pedobacter sp. MC2016-24]MBE9603134.1 DUF4433 domain-containing protein [Pedobacter sp. MC2016-24]